MFTALAVLVVVVLSGGALYALLTYGPGSLYAQYRAEVEGRRAAVPLALVTEADLAPLPPPVARYLRRVGVVGQPRVRDVYAKMTGRIRAAADAPWMPFTAEQHNVADPPARLFYMEATRGGVPVKVFHRFVDGAATMRVKVLSLFTMADGKGDEITRAETVTLLNDMCLLAPAMLLDPQLVWEPVDKRTARVAYTLGKNTVRAELGFNTQDELVEFVSDDRSMSSPDGRSSTPMRWTTPIDRYAEFGLFHLMAHGAAFWHPDAGGFAYIEMEMTHIAFNTLR